MQSQFCTVEEALEELRAGRLIITIDDPDRENEGDLICAAQFATTENVNFMAVHAKGLICTPMSAEIADRLGLEQMVKVNTDNHATAFTVSIDHVDTTTGISAEERGYTVSSMVYPVMQVVMAPAAAWLMEAAGVAAILIGQGALSLLAACVESRISVREERRPGGEGFSLRRWLGDLRDAAAYLKGERGLLAIYTYMAVTNGVASGYSPLFVACFSAAPALYSLFSVAEFAGRSIGGAVRYRREIPRGKRFKFAFFVYNAYELMDATLLWLPYPLMLVNRAAAGYLGIGSATMRLAAVQSYIPDGMRSRINAFEGVMYYLGMGVFSLIVGALGEVMSPGAAVSVSALFAMAVCWLTIFRRRREVGAVYDAEPETAA